MTDDVEQLIERLRNLLNNAPTLPQGGIAVPPALIAEAAVKIEQLDRSDIAARLALSKAVEERNNARVTGDANTRAANARADLNSELIGKIEREWTQRLVGLEAERDALLEALRALCTRRCAR